jgi:hypothetical protein
MYKEEEVDLVAKYEEIIKKYWRAEFSPFIKIYPTSGELRRIFGDKAFIRFKPGVVAFGNEYQCHNAVSLLFRSKRPDLLPLANQVISLVEKDLKERIEP